MTKLIFLIEPRGKGRPRLGRRGAFTDPATRKYEAALKATARAQCGAKPLPLPVLLKIRFIMPVPKNPVRTWHTVKPDLDNMIKAICDALNGVVWIDDSQVYAVDAAKLYDLTNPTPRIEVEPSFRASNPKPPKKAKP